MSIVAVRRLPFVGARSSKRPPSSSAALHPPPSKRAGGEEGNGDGRPEESVIDYEGELGSGGGGPEEPVENLNFEGTLKAAVKEFAALLSALTKLYKTEEVEMELVKQARTRFDNLSQKLFALSGALMLSEMVPP